MDRALENSSSSGATLGNSWVLADAETASEAKLTEPKQEAVFFYGLFLRGYPLQKLRADIDVPPEVLARWQRLALRDPWYKTMLERILPYRKHVLAIFDSLVFREMEASPKVQ